MSSHLTRNDCLENARTWAKTTVQTARGNREYLASLDDALAAVEGAIAKPESNEIVAALNAVTVALAKCSAQEDANTLAYVFVNLDRAVLAV